MTSPQVLYEQDLSRSGFQRDAAQAVAVQHLERLYQQWVQSQQPRKPWWLRWMRSATVAPPQGIYLWGGVGRGKTHLMDTFFQCLPTERKLRIHFHRMMQRVHHELNELKGCQDPLILVARRLAKEIDVLCFDEFFVSDITDAMLLAGLLDALFAHGIILVATSNIPPAQLYWNGLQRQRFLPAIELLEQHCQIVELDNGLDYRLRTLTQAEIYHYPLDAKAATNLDHYFQLLSQEHTKNNGFIEVLGRPIRTVRQGEGVLMIDFKALCDGPRGQGDYIELAQLYHTILLKGVCRMGNGYCGDDVARRFIAMVDEFYDRGVKLIMSAEVALAELYQDGRLTFEFQRCQSRLSEMQSTAYLARPHLP
ncbi:MAG: cell division protein ZapE [Ferrimonas sp.]